jgi:hypothetical protein
MLDEPNPNDVQPPDDFNEEPVEEVPAEAGNNRTFWIVGGILGGLILLTLACVVGYIFILQPRLAAQRSGAAQATTTANAALSAQFTSTALAALFTPTSQPTATFTNTAIPTLVKATATPVVAVNPAQPTNTGASEAVTLAFLQTQLSSQMTSTAAALKGTQANTTPAGTAALAATGFFDEVGLPSLIVLTVALLAVIFLARRLRGAPVR